MVRKKVTALLLCAVMICTMLCGCNASGSTRGSVNSQYKQEVASAAKKLNETYTNYVISTVTEFDDSQQEYIEVIKGDDIYTEFSVDDEGNLGGVSYGSTDSISYALADWTHDGKFYSIGYDEYGEQLYKFPDNFATKYNNDREMLWVNKLLAGATKIETYDDLELTLAGNQETFKAYRITVTAQTVMELLNTDSWGAYMSIKDSEKSGSNISKLCDFYIEDSRLSRTYSEGRVIVAIDQDGILKFMSLETGGLGTRLYVTKAVVDVRNQNVRDMPDFSSAVPIVSTMTELADFVAQYPDYDSALKALQDKFTAEYDDYQGSLDNSPVDVQDEPDGAVEGEGEADFADEGSASNQ